MRPDRWGIQLAGAARHHDEQKGRYSTVRTVVSSGRVNTACGAVLGVRSAGVDHRVAGPAEGRCQRGVPD
ncbi:hypothetical protein [Streptomyces sp. NBC_00690]|uniref:hypothetical protein n=1 Tax=Streptomyces sp. NBC_00690 TaxID=2975808 RepID=UPI002E2DB8BE|nr:hypothetical protein [Streptomyces sp. NBC_00690]